MSWREWIIEGNLKLSLLESAPHGMSPHAMAIYLIAIDINLKGMVKSIDEEGWEEDHLVILDQMMESEETSQEAKWVQYFIEGSKLCLRKLEKETKNPLQKLFLKRRDLDPSDFYNLPLSPYLPPYQNIPHPPHPYYQVDRGTPRTIINPLPTTTTSPLPYFTNPLPTTTTTTTTTVGPRFSPVSIPGFRILPENGED